MTVKGQRVYHKPQDHRMAEFEDEAQRLADLRLSLMLWPTFLKVALIHFFLPYDKQIKALGKGRPLSSDKLPERWAFHAGDVVREFIDDMIAPIRHRSCYWRSQMLFDLLPRFGFEVKMHVGARFGRKKKVDSHLWITLGGRILADTAEKCARFDEMEVYDGRINA